MLGANSANSANSNSADQANGFNLVLNDTLS